MKAKVLAITAIICGASIFGMNIASAAAFNIQTTQSETQQLSQKVRDRNTAIAAVVGVAAIAAASKHHDRHHSDYYDRYDHDRNYNRPHRHNPPPPPPPHYRHHRR